MPALAGILVACAAFHPHPQLHRPAQAQRGVAVGVAAPIHRDTDAQQLELLSSTATEGSSEARSYVADDAMPASAVQAVPAAATTVEGLRSAIDDADYDMGGRKPLSLRKAARYVRRSALIWGCALEMLVRTLALRQRFKGQPETAEVVAARRRLACRLRDVLIMLGPTFIKLGQLLSTRVDVLPREVIRELSQLQNNVPGFPAKRAREIIKQELGKEPEQLFVKFDDTPIAAASLAQVHYAKLASGEEVVVKVQRENLRELFDVDLFNIRLVALLADKLDPQTEGVGSNWIGVAETSGEVLYREINFDYERASADEFLANFAGNPDIKVPRVLAELSTPRVMTMEYCPGVKISDSKALEAAGFDQLRLSELLTTSYLEQICRHGFFHCDPHPGNLAVDTGHPGGRLVYYDFGMMERVEPDVKKGFVDLVFSIYENMPKEACDALQKMGVLRPGIDRFSIERIATDMLNTFQSTLASADNVWENQMSPEEKKASRRARRQKLGADLFATQAERPFLFPPKFTFVFRAFSTIDGIGKGLNPTYDLSRISQPFLRDLIDLRDGSAITTAVREFGKRLGLRPKDIAAVVTQPRAVSNLHSTVKRLEDGDLKLRVRCMEVERTLERVELRQRLVGSGLGAVLLMHVGRTYMGVLRTAFLAVAARLAVDSYQAWSSMEKLELQRLRFSNEAETAYDQSDFYAGEEGKFAS